MKNRALLVLLSIVSLTGSAFATDTAGSNQMSISGDSRDPDRAVRRIIIEGSLANAGEEGSGSTRYNRPNGYTAGVLLDLFGTGNLVMELGALYRQFGTDYNSGLGNSSFTADYISIPIDAKYYFSGQDTASFYIKAGVMGSTLVSNNNLYPTPTTQIGARSWETAVLGGIGGKFALTASTDLLIEADYSRSIDSVLKNASVYRSDLSGVLGIALNL